MKSKPKSIGENPLDAYFTETAAHEVNGTAPSAPKTSKDEPSKSKLSIEKQRLTVPISQDVLEKVRNAVYWTPGLTIAGLTEEALVEAVHKMEKKRGEPFPKREKEISAGRPVR